MPSFLAAASALACERDAIAAISISRLFIMPGITFSIPIFAVLMMPHLTGFIILLLAVCDSFNRVKSLGKPWIAGDLRRWRQ